MQAIVCVSENWGIGLDGQLLFHLSADLKHFRDITTGKTIILGSRTLATFPGGKPLPNRRNIILTHSSAPIEGAEIAHTPEDVMDMVSSGAYVVGGASVYTLLLPRCSRALVTKVYAARRADSFFPNLDNHPDWRLSHESDMLEEAGLRFQFLEYTRR